MDPNAQNSPANPQLSLQPAAGDQAQPSSPAAAAGKGSSARTKARVTGQPRAAVRTGARPRKAASVDEPKSDEGRVAVVMQTSRLTGRHGRAVPRRTTAFVTVERGLQLIVNGDAREASKAETAAAEQAERRVYID